MKLYYAPGACSLSPHIALVEAGLPVELCKVDLRTKKTEDGRDYSAINPKGYVPALELEDGSVLTEGPAIVQYIADQKPDAGLAPKNGTAARYRLQEWLNFVSTEIHKTLGALFDSSMPEAQREATHQKIGKRFDYLAKQLDGRDCLLDQFSVADGYLFTVLNWCRMLKVDLSKWPVLQQYHGRIAQRPAAQQAMKAEGLLK